MTWQVVYRIERAGQHPEWVNLFRSELEEHARKFARGYRRALGLDDAQVQVREQKP